MAIKAILLRLKILEGKNVVAARTCEFQADLHEADTVDSASHLLKYICTRQTRSTQPLQPRLAYRMLRGIAGM